MMNTQHAVIDINSVQSTKPIDLIGIINTMPDNSYLAFPFDPTEKASLRKKMNIIMNRINYYRKAGLIPPLNNVQFFVRTTNSEKRLYKMNPINVTEAK